MQLDQITGDADAQSVWMERMGTQRPTWTAPEPLPLGEIPVSFFTMIILVYMSPAWKKKCKQKIAVHIQMCTCAYRDSVSCPHVVCFEF